eukprot:2968080-Heterocapsa_arctica.AAC.1
MVMTNPAGFAEYDEEAGGCVTSSLSTFKMDGDDSDEGEEETLARQQAANELQQEYDNDFVPAFDIAEETSSEGHPCDLDVDC